MNTPINRINYNTRQERLWRSLFFATLIISGILLSYVVKRINRDPLVIVADENAYTVIKAEDLMSSESIHEDQADSRHVDGYTSVTGNRQFIFPIGDEGKYRPMAIPQQSENVSFKGAYFHEDPDGIITTVNETYDNDKKLSRKYTNFYFDKIIPSFVILIFPGNLDFGIPPYNIKVPMKGTAENPP